jgi:hypothetical protein
MGRFSLVKDESKYKLSAEAAQAQVMQVIEYYRIDIDSQPDRKSQKAIEGVCDRLVTFYRMGLLENFKDGAVLRVKQHLTRPPGESTELLWDKMSAKAKLATDGFDQDDRYARAYALIACLTGLPPDAVKSLEGVDLGAAEDLGLLFLLG